MNQPVRYIKAFGRDIPVYAKEATIERIEVILNNFDFDRVATIMKALKWFWGGDTQQPPIIERMRDTAHKLLQRAVETPPGSSTPMTISSGGLRAHHQVNGSLVLEFVPVSTNDVLCEVDIEEKPATPGFVCVSLAKGLNNRHLSP